MARAIKQISPLTRVQIEEDTWYNDNPLLETRLEEVQSITNGLGQAFEIKPQVEGRVGDGLDVETHVCEAGDDVVALVAEMCLEGLHLCANLVGLEHGNGGFLEGHVGATVKVGTAGADGFDEFLFLVSKFVW